MPAWSPRLVLSVQVSPFVISSAEPLGFLKEKKHSKYRYFIFTGKGRLTGMVGIDHNIHLLVSKHPSG